MTDVSMRARARAIVFALVSSLRSLCRNARRDIRREKTRIVAGDRTCVRVYVHVHVCLLTSSRRDIPHFDGRNAVKALLSTTTRRA